MVPQPCRHRNVEYCRQHGPLVESHAVVAELSLGRLFALSTPAILLVNVVAAIKRFRPPNSGLLHNSMEWATRPALWKRQDTDISMEHRLLLVSPEPLRH